MYILLCICLTSEILAGTTIADGKINLVLTHGIFFGLLLAQYDFWGVQLLLYLHSEAYSMKKSYKKSSGFYMLYVVLFFEVSFNKK